MCCCAPPVTCEQFSVIPQLVHQVLCVPQERLGLRSAAGCQTSVHVGKHSVQLLQLSSVGRHLKEQERGTEVGLVSIGDQQCDRDLVLVTFCLMGLKQDGQLEPWHRSPSKPGLQRQCPDSSHREDSAPRRSQLQAVSHDTHCSAPSTVMHRCRTVSDCFLRVHASVTWRR